MSCPSSRWAWLMVRYAPDPHDRWGLLAGPGGLSLLVGILNVGGRPCPEGPFVITPTVGEDFTCGQLDGRLWLLIGPAIVAAAFVIYVARRRATSAPMR